jgi:hypothetical protein
MNGRTKPQAVSGQHFAQSRFGCERLGIDAEYFSMLLPRQASVK